MLIAVQYGSHLIFKLFSKVQNHYLQMVELHMWSIQENHPKNIHLMCELSKTTEHKGNIKKYMSTKQLEAEIFENIISNRIKFQISRNESSKTRKA